MKKNLWINRLSRLTLVACIMTLCVSTVFAATPRYIALSNFYVELSISNLGYAHCEGSAVVTIGYTADVTLELQQKDGSTWDTVKTWTDSGSAVSFEKGYFVEDGFDYRLKITAKVYNKNGKLIESPAAYSNVCSY